jgi:hypothetical protein
VTTQHSNPLRKSILTKLSGVFLIFLILAILNLISALVSYLFFNKIIGFLNSNFILLTFLLITVFIGSILKDINSRLKYVSPIFYALSGLLILITAINAIVDLDFVIDSEYLILVQSNIIFSYSLAFITILLVGYYMVFTGMSQREITGSVCKFNMFSFCLFMDAVMLFERIFEKISNVLSNFFSYIGHLLIKR